MSFINTFSTATALTLKVLSLYVAIAMLCWSFDPYINPTKPVGASVASIAPETINTDNRVSGQPVNISIDRLGINVRVLDGEYDRASDSWTLAEDAAHFATMTAQPNNKEGSTFIYGHNTDAVFESVRDLVTGDILKITTANGHVFTYTYADDVSVTPDQTDVLAAESDQPQLILMTCEGIFSESRRIMHFDFIGLS